MKDLGGMNVAVLGAGRQGTCAAYDLVAHGRAARVVLADASADQLAQAVARLQRLVPGTPVHTVLADGGDRAALAAALEGCRTAVCALPYRCAPVAARAAIDARCHLVDLGGNSAVSGSLFELHGEAAAAGVAIVPDTGLAPGLANTLAAAGVAELENAREVRIWCGGLPADPSLPFGYRLVFSPAGLINEYSGDAVYLRGGRLVRVPALSEIEELDLPNVGRVEAAPTSGGTSTAPESFAGRLELYEYRTVRYPGHFRRFRDLADLGLFGETPLDIGSGSVRPRELLVRLLARALERPEAPDLVVLRVEVRGATGGMPRIVYDLFDREDPRTGFTAMERCTAYPAAAVAEMAACGEIEPGTRRLELDVAPDVCLRRLGSRPLSICRGVSP
ncbi:MAG: saccharopine dehydrogenase NADP-binding domain-containing protein [Acidobacteria bacterium]|nr:saccharopine dehydrogenase NADP-binding domain-containing protein [Acidobacteriota bacterium]